MYAVGRLGNYISQGVYNVAAPFHPFGGAVDIIVVEQKDGTFKCSPWYVKFGKFQGVLKRREKIVTVSVNGKEAGFHMYLDHKGEAYFLKEVESDEEASIFSPPSAPSSGDEVVVDRRSSGRRISFKEDSFKAEENDTSNSRAVPSPNKEENSGSFSEQIMSPNVEEKQCENGMPDSSSSKSSSVKNGKINLKSPSRRKSIFSLVFRSGSQRSSKLEVVASATDQNDGQSERNRRDSLEQANLVVDLLDTRWANGDTDNKEGNDAQRIMEMNVFSSSAGDDAQSLDLSSKLSEQKMISDGDCPLPQDNDPVCSIANQEDYVQDSEKQDVVCYHDGESSVDNCAKMDNFVKQSDPETCQSQPEVVIFSMEETSNKLNKFDEQISGNSVTSHSEGSIHHQADINYQELNTHDPVLLYTAITDVKKGSSEFDEFREKTFENNIASLGRSFVCDQEHTQSPQSKILNLAELSRTGMNVLSTSIDDSQDARLTHVSELITPLQDVGADSEYCMESERIYKKQVVDNVLQFPMCNSREEELMEHIKQEEDLQQMNSTADLDESSRDFIASGSLSDNHCGLCYPTDSLMGTPCDPVLCEETCERTKTGQQVSDDEVEFVTKDGDDGINKITSDAKTDSKVAIHVIDQKDLNRSSFCDHDSPGETIICGQKLVSEEASNRAHNLLYLADDIDPCTQSNLGTMTSKEVPDSSVEPSTGGWNDEIQQLPCSVKLDEEVFIHATCAKQPDGSSFTGFDTNRNDQRLVPKETFNYTNAQEDMEVTLTCNNLIYCKLDNAHKVQFQMQHEVCKLECSVSNNNHKKMNEAHILCEETYLNQTIRSETSQDLEMNFNDEYVLNNCLAGSVSEEENSNEELVLSDPQPDDNHTSTSLDSDASRNIGDSTMEYSNDNGSHLSRIEIAPINILGCMEGKEDTMRAINSLPNLGNNFLDMTTADTAHVLSRSLDSDSSYLKRGVNYELPFSNSQNTESRDSEKEAAQNWTMRENFGSSKIWTTSETASASVHPYYKGIGIEISLCRHLLFEGMGTDAAAQAFDSLKVSSEQFLNSRSYITNNENLVVRMEGQYFPWDAVAPVILGMVAFGLEGPPEPDGAIPVERVEKALEKFASDSFVRPGGGWRIWPFLRRKSKTPERSKSAQIILSNDLIGSESQASFDSSFSDYYSKTGKNKERSNTPTSEQLASLNLNEGQNIITFTFSTRVLGKQQVDARIYLWKWNTRIVVSDVDGTITKSDVLGQFMPWLGKDWTQSGVAHLFSAIKDNGYQLMFLSARAIAQAYLTRQFLLNIKQDGKALPDGPIVISPDGLFPSLYREVIRRAPHEFKIACLEDIRKLFPLDCNPFYAGFGNRDTDEISYLKVGIPKGKIFIINPKGEVAVNHRVDTKSYTSLHSLVNDMFPAMSSSEQEDFNSWNYWKMPLPNIDI